MEDLTWSPERKLSAYSLAERKDEEYVGNEEEGEDEDKEEGEGEEEGDGDMGENHGEGDGVVGEVKRRCHRPFILPLIWMMNDFYPTMFLKVFNNLCNHY